MDLPPALRAALSHLFDLWLVDHSDSRALESWVIVGDALERGGEARRAAEQRRAWRR